MRNNLAPLRSVFDLNDFFKGFDLLDETGRGAGLRRRTAREFLPSVDIQESATDYRLSFDLPGIPKENVKVEVNERVLTVSGERTQEERKDENGHYRSEKVYGKFSRSFRLPDDIDLEAVKATQENGVLNLVLPKSKSAAPRTIQVA